METEESLGSVPLSSTDLEGVVVNLFNNSFQAIGDQAGTIRIEMRSEMLQGDETLADGRYVHISVEDSGEGMSAENLERIFDPFFTTKEVGKGTGLGLAQAKGIVEAAGGAIRAVSAIGEGTTMAIYLPIKQN